MRLSALRHILGWHGQTLVVNISHSLMSVSTVETRVSVARSEKQRIAKKTDYKKEEKMATMETECDKKEQTILELSETIGKELGDFRARLDNYFDRKITGNCAETGAEQIPNVLDEIIQALELDLGELRRMVSFVANEVLPKIK